MIVKLLLDDVSRLWLDDVIHLWLDPSSDPFPRISRADQQADHGNGRGFSALDVCFIRTLTQL